MLMGKLLFFVLIYYCVYIFHELSKHFDVLHGILCNYFSTHEFLLAFDLVLFVKCVAHFKFI